MARGQRIQAMAIAPTMLSICAAGPVRVCQNSSKVAAQGPAPRSASVRLNRPRSPRLCHASKAQPNTAVNGKPSIIVAICQPWR